MPIYQSPTRALVRDVEGILFTLNIGAIGASSTLQYNLEDRHPSWKKYLPFNSVTVINNSGSHLTIAINQDSAKSQYVPAGSIMTISGYGIIALSVTTDTTAVASGELQFTFERQGMVVDQFTKALASNVFVQRLLGIGRG